MYSQLCVQNSPQEARNMLLQNPQLAYALLQAQVVMRIVDPEIALVCPSVLIGASRMLAATCCEVESGR